MDKIETRRPAYKPIISIWPGADSDRCGKVLLDSRYILKVDSGVCWGVGDE